VPSVFTRIIKGELPARTIYRDETCLAILDVRPLNRGHTLVIPTTEIDRWTDLPVEVAAHCMVVAQAIGSAQQKAFSPIRVGLLIAGFEVPHAHIHVVPIDHMQHLDFSLAQTDVDPTELDATAKQLRVALRLEGSIRIDRLQLD